jgi:hypothetical protein
MVVVGINTELPISDFLPLRIGDFVDQDGHIRECFSIRAERSDKRNVVVINTSIRDALDKYIETYPDIVQTAITSSSFQLGIVNTIKTFRRR